jgi:hypothetical protein
MQRLKSQQLFTFLFLLRARLVLMQETIQVRIIHECSREYEIQQCEKLIQAILQRGARDEQSSTRDEGPADL